MKNPLNSLVVLAMTILASSCQGQNAKEIASKSDVKMSTDLDSLSYAIGLDIGKNLKMSDLDNINIEIMSNGMLAAFKGDESVMNQQKTQDIISKYVQKLQQKKQEESGKQLQGNKDKCSKFLADNAKKSGVKTLPSGLQYSVIKEGKGAKPKETDVVKTHYHGTLIDGTVFDSSVDRGEPATFPVNGVIKGWVEALQLMSVGSKWKLFVPSDLAYGDNGMPPTIGPGETLIFEVELISIETGK